MTIMISARTVARALSVTVALLLLAGVTTQFSKHVLGHDVLLGLVRLFDLNGEGNIPAWYSSMALLLSSALLAVIARAKRFARDPYVWHWAVLAVIFLGFSFDEAASLHEMLVKPLRAALHARGVLYFTWVIPAAAFVLVVGLSYLRFLAHLPEGTRRRFIIAGGLFIGGALGVELAGGYVADMSGGDNLLQAGLVALEEGMEMVGIVVFIHALLSYLGAQVGEVRIRFGD